MSRKKGLSEVVTTVIVILLSLVAVGIVWVVVKNVVSSGAEGISLGTFTNNLVIKSVVLGNDSISVNVKRSSGDDNITSLSFIFGNETFSQKIEKQTDIQRLEQETFIFSLSDLNVTNISKISIAVVYLDNSGKRKEGDVVDTFKLKGSRIFSGTGLIITEVVIKNFEKYGPVGAGTSDYSVSSAGGLLPAFTRVIIDPLDVHLGDNQTFTVYVSSTYNITEVTTKTQLDTEVLVLPLTKVTDGVYSATWNVYDTHTQVYRTNFTAKDSGGNENSLVMSWTDPCTGFAHGSTSTVTTGCTISTIDGVDTGNIVVGQGGSITINDGATLAYTPGYSISKTGTGSILLGSTGTITKQYIFYPDADGDTYAKNGTLWIGTSSTSAGKVRAASALSTADANDANAACWVNKYTDADGDSYCNGAGVTCVGAQGGYATSCTAYSDCNDAAGTAWVSKYTDADSDGYCNGAGTTCVGNNAGYADSCNAYSDCNDASGSVWQTVSCYVDGDSDGVFGSGTSNICIGSSCAGAGYSASPGSDCNDASGSVWQTLSCEVDADNDNYCGANANACVGAACAETCATAANADCNDANAGLMTYGYPDADQDGYCTSASASCQGDAGVSTSCSGYTDCNDNPVTGGSTYQTLSCEVDADNDDYCGANSNQCVGYFGCSDVCTTAANADCNDNNAGITQPYTLGANCNCNGCGCGGTITDACTGTCSGAEPENPGSCQDNAECCLAGTSCSASWPDWGNCNAF